MMFVRSYSTCEFRVWKHDKLSTSQGLFHYLDCWLQKTHHS